MADPALLGPVDSGITVARCAPAQAFVIDFSDGEMKSKENKKNLQESFLRFKKQKQKEIRDEKRLRARRLRAQGDPLYMDKLRKKFIKTAKKYYGVPYAKKYWKPEQPEFRSPIFLDCCGLVRQVMYDLRKDFGFRLGPWNQAYMFDTLPLVVESEENMKPGDLVFMSGVYPRPQARQQKHYMTHVEIWAGQGTKTIGARWNNGKVSLWDDYRFEAKSFTDAKYHFRSIDTWLQGICRSFCPEHKWKRSSYNANKKSIFNVENQKKKKKKHTKSAHVGERPSESREKAGQSQSQEQKENGLQSPQEDKQDSVDQLEENDILDIENDSILSPLNLDDVDIEDEDDEDEDDQEEDVDDGEEEEEDPVEAACDSDIEELQGGLSVQGFGTTRDKRKTVESPSRIEFRPETNLLSITRLTQINRNLSHMLEQYPIFPRLSWRPEDSVFDKKNHRFSFKSFQNSPFHIKSPRSEINNSLQKENSSLGFVKISGRCMTAEQNTRVHSQPSDYKEESEETRRLKERMARFTLTNASDIPSPRLQRSYTTLSKSYLGNHSTVSPRCRQQRPLGISPTVCRFPVILNDIDTLNNKFVPEGVLKMNKDRLNQSKGQTHQNDPKDQENIFSIHKKSIEERWTAFNKLEKSHPVLLMSKEATELETDNKNNNVPKEESLGHEQEDIDDNKVDDVSTHKSPFNISSSQDETMALPSFSKLRHTVDISQYGGEGMMTLDLSIPPPVDSPLDDRQG